MEGFVIDRIKAYILTEDNIEELVRLTNEELTQAYGEDRERLELIQAQIEGMDGRLPDRLELMDLYYDYPEERKKMKDIYWSTRKQGNSGGWAVDFGDSDNDADPEISSCSVRCVRETAKGK